MKRFLLVLFVFSFAVVFCKEVQKPIQVYLCSRLTHEAKEWNKLVVAKCSDPFSFFMPQDIDVLPFKLEEFDKEVYEACLVGMEGAHFLLVLPPYGRDCAFEIGWFSGKGKPAFAYVEQGGEWMRDAMVKGGLAAIITCNKELYANLLKDEATKHKSHLISSKEALKGTIEKIYKELQEPIRKRG